MGQGHGYPHGTVVVHVPGNHGIQNKEYDDGQQHGVVRVLRARLGETNNREGNERRDDYSSDPAGLDECFEEHVVRILARLRRRRQ